MNFEDTPEYGTQFVPNQNEERLQKTRQATTAYIQTLYALLPYLDLTNPSESTKAHGILNMCEQIQKMQAGLENPEPSREERKEAFGRRA